MVQVKRLVLDVLKPHSPNSLVLATAIAEKGEGYRVSIDVQEMDEKTETLVIVVEGEQLDFDLIQETITELGASLHSVDQVDVVNEARS